MSVPEQAPERGTVLVRTMRAEDAAMVAAAFAAQGWYKPVEQYTRYLEESAQGRRVVLLAERGGEFAGYVTVVWESDYPPFRESGIPEIVDFNVLIKHQRCGIGTALLDEAERRIAVRSPVAGIGVGLTADYGAAQVLYVKRGYIPDGRGTIQHGRAVRHGEQVTIDDDLAICFTKRL
jgi:ribosomal protein S18 acetylase RimI-like enzyme